MGKFRNWYRNEHKKIENLSLQQRAEYILGYYWLYIIGILAVIFFIIYLVWHSATTISDNWIYIAFPNAEANVGNKSDMWYEYVEWSGYDIKKKNVEFNSSLYFDPTTSSGTNNTYYQVFVAITEAGTLDAVTMRKEEIEALGSSGRLMNLNDAVAEGLGEEYKDRLVFSIPEDEEYSTDPVPVGIDVSDSILITRYHIYEESCVLSIGEYSSHVEAIKKFLKWIMQTNSS